MREILETTLEGDRSYRFFSLGEQLSGVSQTHVALHVTPPGCARNLPKQFGELAPAQVHGAGRLLQGSAAVKVGPQSQGIACHAGGAVTARNALRPGGGGQASGQAQGPNRQLRQARAEEHLPP